MATREQSGIYTVTHLASGRMYVGQSQRVDRRMREHLTRLRSGNHCNAKLQAAFNSYGEAAFSFELLTPCHVEDLDAQEQYWANLLSPAFNLAPVAGTMRGYRFTEAQRQKMRNAFSDPAVRKARSDAKKAMWQKPGFREAISSKISATLTGRKQSADSNAKRAKSQTGRKMDAQFCAKVTAGKLASGFKFSDDSRRKMSQAQTGKKQSPETVAKRRATIAARHGECHGA